jgi:hypothetical protein
MYRDALVAVARDVQLQALVHVLVIPKEYVG